MNQRSPQRQSINRSFTRKEAVKIRGVFPPAGVFVQLEKYLADGFIKSADLPTGGKIVGLDGIRDAYESGRGSFKMRATARVESVTPRRKGIVVTELPYGVGTERVMEQIKKLVLAKKLQGIADIKDLTDREKGLRLVIEVKNGFNPEAILERVIEMLDQHCGEVPRPVIRTRRAGLGERSRRALMAPEVFSRARSDRAALSAPRRSSVPPTFRSLEPYEDTLKLGTSERIVLRPGDSTATREGRIAAKQWASEGEDFKDNQDEAVAIAEERDVNATEGDLEEMAGVHTLDDPFQPVVAGMSGHELKPAEASVPSGPSTSRVTRAIMSAPSSVATTKRASRPASVPSTSCSRASQSSDWICAVHRPKACTSRARNSSWRAKWLCISLTATCRSRLRSAAR